MEPAEFGVLSLLPPVLAVGLAIATRQVLLSLFLGVWMGTTMLAGWNPLVGLVDVWRAYAVPQMADSWNASVLLMMFILGGFAALLERGGGAHAFAEALKGKITDSRRGQVLSWAGGLAIWFSDSTNPVVVGPVLRPVTDRVRISREKLAYIVDATSAQDPALIPFTAWGAYIMSLIAKEFQPLGVSQSPFSAFVAAIPWQLYSLTALVMVLVIALTRLDYGPMRRAEIRAAVEGKVFRDGAKPLRQEVSVQLPAGAGPTIWDMVAPIVVLLGTIIFMLEWTGGFPKVGFLEAFSKASTMPSLIMGFFLGSVTAGYMAVRSRVFTASQALDVWLDGARGMVLANLILILAWSIGSICKAVGTAKFVVSAATGILNPALVPVVIFLVGAFMSFATGTSWGTFAILMPLAVPLAVHVGTPVHAAIAAVISGGLFGDHCSPISDTTILSSMGSTCDHIDHVNTQLPYALTSAFAAAVGYVLGGLTGNAGPALVVALAVMVAAVYVLGTAAGGPVPRQVMHRKQGQGGSVQAAE